ncbi:MAG: molybdate ABC transporter substrate-binding protein [Xanthobacteraceae bacterium]
MQRAFLRLAAVGALVLVCAQAAPAAGLKVLTAGAFKQVLLALAPAFEQQTGQSLAIDNDTAGALARRIAGGEAFDVAILGPAAVDELARQGKFAPGSRTVLAKVGVGVVVKAGAPKPDIGTVEAFKRAVLEARSVAYIDPASGGSSGIFVAGLFERLGLAVAVKPKVRLIPGGAVAEHIANGEAELGIHQISEIVPVQGVTLVGPLPAEIQNYTTYAAGVGALTQNGEAAAALLKLLSGAAAAPVIRQKGMEPAS